MSRRTRPERQRRFVTAYLSVHPEASAVNADFNDAFAFAFGRVDPAGTVRPLKRIVKAWGACPCPRALDVLRQMWRGGLIERRRIGLVEHGPGFPNWTYSYTLPPDQRMPRPRALRILSSHPAPSR